MDTSRGISMDTVDGYEIKPDMIVTTKMNNPAIQAGVQAWIQSIG